jgi:hypothetical protein
MKREKISINILLVDIAHIYVYWNLERNGFYQREMDFLSKRNGFFSRRHGSTRRHGTKERKEKTI